MSDCLVLYSDGVGVLSRPAVGLCALAVGFDAVGVFGPEGGRWLSDCLVVYSDGVGVLSRPAVGQCEFDAGSDGVKMRWAKGVKEMSDRYLF